MRSPFRSGSGQSCETCCSPTRSRPQAPAGPRAAAPGVGFSAVVALGAAGVAVVLALGSGGELAPQRASAASVLRASAGALERSGASLALGRGDSLYTRTAIWWRYADLASRPIVVRSVDERWIARDGAGRDRTRVISHSRGSGGPGDPTRSTDVALPVTARPFLLSTLPSRGSPSPKRSCDGCPPIRTRCARP